jgi:hypothetical protein
MRPVALFSQGKMARFSPGAGHWPGRSDDRQADVHIAPGGVGIRAYQMRLRDQRLGIGAVEARQGNRQVDVEAETASKRRNWSSAAAAPRTRQVLIALTPRGQALTEKARAVPEGILAASNCSVAELSAMKNELVALRARLNAALGE